MTTDRWWVYKRPFLRDRPFMVGLVLGVVNLAFAVDRQRAVGSD